MVLTELNVPARKSVKFVGRWALGSMYYIEHYPNFESVPKDAVAQWSENGAILCLRPQVPCLTSEADGWAEPGRIQATTSNGVWEITRETLVKICSWEEGYQTEASSIKFVNKCHPEIPTTQVIFDWIDYDWTRSFMIMKRAPGVLMDEAMAYMTDSQIEDIAEEVAVHIKTLTQQTSAKLETIDHCGVAENRLIGWSPLKDAPHEPSCYPKPWPPFTAEEFRAHLIEASGMNSIPDSGNEFVLYNSDITTHNLFVFLPHAGEKGRLAQIIDWEYTAYWPRYWVATCAQPERPFVLPYVDGREDTRWPLYLNKALVRAGFESLSEWWADFDDASEKLRHERRGEEYDSWLDTIRKTNLMAIKD